MAFRGLFVGIDRYASPAINWLRCARRDAVALHALFSDTLGSGAVLLTDEQASRAAIEDQFVQLAACDADDVVVIAFSGHGSSTHELVTYDADIRDLPNTCIPLDLLTEWFKRIPARRLVCLLDCCFSGGMGAKVLQVETAPRDLASTTSLLDQLSGTGRLIFTASSATEPAWEHSRLGHGLLTNYLLEALLGAEEVRLAGRVSVYRLLEYVTQRVVDAAAQLGKPQHPTLRGQLEGELIWPVFTAGPRYRAAFPERHRSPATHDVQSLAGFGFPTDLLTAWAGAIPGLNQLQIDAINDFDLLEGAHLVVSAPTSSGKTMVGELAALKGVLDRKRALFLLPLKALVNDKHQHFTRTYGPFGLRTIRATGEIIDDIPALMRGQYDVCLMTYEKFSALILGSPHLLDQVGTIVVDEAQMIADPSRGTNLEFLLTLLRVRRQQGIEPQLILLSAVIGDTNGLERWLGARLLRRDERPVPLEEGLLLADGSFRSLDPTGQEQLRPAYVKRQWGKGSSQDWVIPLVRALVADGKQVIVFRTTRGEARGCAAYLARELGLPPAQAALDALPAGDPSLASHALRETLAGGVAFHISDLDRDERRVIEEQFRTPNSSLRVISATTTLAMGINTPAEAVVIVGLEHPGQPPQPYTVAEYKNMVGRAGRLGFAARGLAILIASTPKDAHDGWVRYVCGQPEDLESRFLARGTDPRSLIVRVLVAAQRSVSRGLPTDDIVSFLESSFGVFQQRRVDGTWRWDHAQLLTALADLTQHGLVERDHTGDYRLTELGRLAGEGGIEVESIIRLVEALTPLDPASITEATLVTAAQLTVEVDQLLFPLNTRSTQKEPQVWRYELARQQVPASLLQALLGRTTEQHQSTRRAKKAVACLLWITDRPLAEVETILTQFGGGRDGAAGAIRSVAARTADVLSAVARVAEILHPGLDLSTCQARLFTRLDVGVPAEAVQLATLVGARLGRSDYQQLLKAGLDQIDGLEAATDEALLVCLGGSTAKLAELRNAVRVHRERQAQDIVAPPFLPILGGDSA